MVFLLCVLPDSVLRLGATGGGPNFWAFGLLDEKKS